MPPVAEKPLAEAAASLLAPAEELAHTSLSSLAELFSISLADAATLLAGAFAVLHGTDFDFFDFDTPLNPANVADDVSVQIGTCDAAPAGERVTKGYIAEAFAFAPPSDYGGGMPENVSEEEIFKRFWREFTCDELDEEAETMLEYMRPPVNDDELRINQRTYRMARDILDYKRNHGLC